MRLLIWSVFIAGAVAAGLLGGETGAFIFLAAVLVAVTFFRRPLVLALSRLASRLGLIRGTIERMPSMINLTRTPSRPEAARPILTALAAINFTDAGAWEIAQMPKIQLSLMVQRDEGMLAAVESAFPIGAHVNVHPLYPDGLVVTFTNSEPPVPKVLRPNVQRTRLPRCSPDTLVARARSERPKRPFRPLSIEEAPRIYEQLYADEIRFRKATGR